MTDGDLCVLNIGQGDMKLSFDNKDPQEAARAERVVQDMLDRGYALFVHGGGKKLARVKAFDPQRREYIIADGPTAGPKKKMKKRVSAAKSRVTAIAPTSGG